MQFFKIIIIIYECTYYFKFQQFTKWVYYLFNESGEFYLGDKFLSATSCNYFSRNCDLNIFYNKFSEIIKELQLRFK
jgi:hypothetical protein